MTALGTIRTSAAIVVALAACVGAALPTGAVGASAAKVPRCETITVKGARWGVYIEKGNVTCSTAAVILTGVLAAKGKDIDNGPGSEYLRYSGWSCPYFQMGVLTCGFGTKPVASPARSIFGLSCSTAVGEPACPARGEA